MKRTNNAMLQTVDEIIDAFGGDARSGANNSRVAKWLGINTSVVCNWRTRANIPSGWHLRFYLEAERRGFRIDGGIFGLEACQPSPSPELGTKKKRQAPANARAKKAA